MLLLLCELVVVSTGLWYVCSLSAASSKSVTILTELGPHVGVCPSVGVCLPHRGDGLDKVISVTGVAVIYSLVGVDDYVVS